MQAWLRSGTTALIVCLLAVAGLGLADQESAPLPAAVQVASPQDASLDVPDAERPNIVFVMTDDMRDDELRWMPHTRRLLRDRGTDFTDAVSPHPLCCPARAQLVTGQYAQNNGVQHNAGPFGGFQALDPSQEISAWFKQAGYQTGFVGKFLNGYTDRDRRPAGWDRWDALSSGVYDYFDFSFDNDGSPVAFRDSYVTEVIADRTNQTVRDFAADDEPFLVYSWHLGPHYRINRQGKPVPAPAATDDKGRFADSVPSVLGDSAFNEGDVLDQPRPFRTRRLAREDLVVTEHRARLRALQSVDRAVESLVETLRSVGELNSTVIVFASDNGYSLGEHRFIGKNVLTQEVLQVPLLVRGPGIASGATNDLPVTLVDLPATFTALAGVTPGWLLDGTSVTPALAGQDQPFRDTTLVQTGDDGGDGWAYRGVRTSRYLYGVNGSDGFLYDRLVDPDQLTNLLLDPAYAEIRALLEQRRLQLLSCRGATCNRTFGLLPEPG
ncbi:MAG: Choline-sulfatase [uncultured Nocardioides sp.]|uniref:Choline-sulfatase n=1 Tax=uncultured Nocardioides sp. TaxID=198441 RepID=A0A6J4N4Z5_9ACTN|nr:MAG: Choline-sulfatase [uncultured Nocardioides sp.]